MIARILVALDESQRAPMVFVAAAELAEALGAELILFRVISVPPEFPAAGAGGARDELEPHLARAAHESLMTYARARPDLTSRVVVRAEHSAHQAIVRAADEHSVDLVIVGSHGYHGLDRVLGTTAGRVADLAHISVLVVHAPNSKGGRVPRMSH